MILAIDIGNTHIVLGCLDEDNNVLQRMMMSSDKNETSYEYAAEIRTVLSLKGLDLNNFDGAIISSVVPEVTRAVSAAVYIITGKEPLVLGHGAKVELSLDMNGLSSDAIAGDLLATAIAAKKYYTLPAIIVDMGTATTITVVDRTGTYIGGAIVPGPGTALKGLVRDTSLLPAVEFVAPDRAIAKDTVNAMRCGIVYGSAGALDGIIDRFLLEMEGDDPTILATGGMGKIIAPYCRHKIIIDNELLLKGLGIIWYDNQIH
ncbi:MAG: type III pantothenate kinase [Eubacterium sp.]|nr:type III pantothenate kinase [Eubacterium sp.]